jgi:hypothetical protein
MMLPQRRTFAPLALAGALFVGAGSVSAWEMAGTKQVALHTRDGQTIPIGSVTFVPQGERTGFVLHLDHARFKDFFLSMKEFKCVEGPEIQCHVPYPYANPATVTANDLSWLEHALMFLYKAPTEFGARLWNGLYYRMAVTEQGIVGTPQAIDLGLISAPPTDTSTPPFGPAERGEVAAGTRWIRSLSIR